MTLKSLGFNKFKEQEPFRKLTLKLTNLRKIIQFRNHLLNEIWTFKIYLKFEVSL